MIERSELASHAVEVLVSAEELRTCVDTVLRGLGTPPSESAIQADVLLEADLRGRPSHGVQRLPVIVERIRNGVAVPGAEISVTWLAPSFASVDGQRGLGPVVAFAAVDAVSDRARKTGIAVAAVSNANHVGMLAPYVERLATRGQIGIAMTTSEALVHPLGGRRAMIGTNPLGIAVPATPHPFVLDMATGHVSMGRILAHLHRGEDIPSGWALDQDGDPTTSALAASTGSISPFGGAKGYGLGLAIELLVATLTASAIGRDVRGTLDSTEICNKGDLFVCIDPMRAGIEGLSDRAAEYLHEIRTGSGDPGEVITTPGDRSRALREMRLASGIPVATEVWERLRELRAAFNPA